MSQTEYDICIIGGGAGGLVVAAGGAALGAKVVLVEKKHLGGDCLHYGCVPSKTLLHSARVAQAMRNAGKFGLPEAPPQVDLPTVMKHVQQVISTIEVNDSPQRFRDMGVEVIFGAGRFTSSECFQVDGHDLTAKTFVIATGSRPAIPPVPGLDKVPYLTNESIFSLNEAVEHLIIMGGGPIGIEMCQAFIRLGSRVTVVERSPQILPREDHELVAIVAARLAQEGVEFRLNSTASNVSCAEGEIALTLSDTDGKESILRGSHLLVSAGRRSNVDGLGLKQAGVEVVQGRIKTDAHLRTSNRKIFGCGDVVGPYQFTHMAEHHAGVVLRNAIFHLPAKIEQRVIPWCTFTEPELARVGLSETEARKQNIPCEVFSFPFHDIDRAQAEGETEGMAKIITNSRGKLLGAALVGPNAGELIHEYTLALAKGMKAADLSSVIHIYPTLAQINRRVADQRMKTGLTPRRLKWIKRLFGLRGS